MNKKQAILQKIDDICEANKDLEYNQQLMDECEREESWQILFSTECELRKDIQIMEEELNQLEQQEINSSVMDEFHYDMEIYDVNEDNRPHN